MKNKKTIGILSVVIAVALLAAGCSSKNYAITENLYGSGSAKKEYAPAAPESISLSGSVYEEKSFDYITSETTAYDMEVMDEAEMVADYKDDSRQTGGTPMEHKLIVTTSYDLETKDFDKTLEDINKLVSEHNGYIESSSVQGVSIQSGYQQPRYAYFTLRIPQKSSENFLTTVTSDFYVVSTSQSTQDATESYYNLEAKLNSYLEQEESLKKLLEVEDVQGNLEHLLAVERELAIVRANINEIYTQMKSIDSLVNFDTVHITVAEVVEHKPIEYPTETFGGRIVREMKLSWQNFIYTIQDGVVFILTSWYKILFILIAAVVILAIYKTVKKKTKGKADKVKKEITPAPTKDEKTESKKKDEKTNK